MVQKEMNRIHHPAYCKNNGRITVAISSFWGENSNFCEIHEQQNLTIGNH